MGNLAVLVGLGLALAGVASIRAEEQLQVRISWGHQTPVRSPFYVKVLTQGVTTTTTVPQQFEPEDRFADGAWLTEAGGGDVDAIQFDLHFVAQPISSLTNLHRIWADLISRSDPDTARRLRSDPAYRRDPRSVTVQMNEAGTKGFSFTVDQLLEEKAFWIPALDVYVAAGNPGLSFAAHQAHLATWKGKRVLDQVHLEPEASYGQFTNRWEDMGHPDYRKAAQTGPGHIVCVTWDSALNKFGIDRSGGVWNDYGSPDRFHCWLDFADISQALGSTWRGQHLSDGLPIVTTVLEKEHVRYELEQFAFPLDGPPDERQGDMPMVLLQKITAANLTDERKTTHFRIYLRRQFPNSTPVTAVDDGVFSVREGPGQRVLLTVQGAGNGLVFHELRDEQVEARGRPAGHWKCVELVVPLALGPHQSREILLKLPSPGLPPGESQKLASLDFQSAREQTRQFWSEYLTRGARFEVPEAAVNELVRANLWHALRLPRRHGGEEPGVKIDLPYSNFAYDQRGTPWPVNQAVYVDYMLYDLRGYHDLSAEELQVIYNNNQDETGHVGGYANWLVYTPGMLYAVGKNFLLSGDRGTFEDLLPQSIKAMGWCLAALRKASARTGAAEGLVRGPLNDLSGDGDWAFNQAYLYAGLDVFGRALAQWGDPRAAECREGAASIRRAIERGFGAASMRSPLVQLRDHTWSPYVPCEVTKPRRLLDQWYPTDVDTGATHLARLQAIAPDGPLADALLNDHEDNLFLHAWGMANEPVYNQQATAYLSRDDPKAVIRAFYSMMACAFSHSVFEPVEHRWTWGQDFGPPSTDGAWFELFRHMLIRELDDDSLLLLQATPRAWLEDGKTISVERAPTYFGPLSFRLKSQAASRTLTLDLDMPQRTQPKALLICLRHPQSNPLRSVSVNGQAWTDFDPAKESVRIPNPGERQYHLTARY